MRRAFPVLIVGILVLLSASFTQVYNHVPVAGNLKTEHHETVLEQVYFNPVDYPQQEGNLRGFKEVTQKVRSSEDDIITYLGLASAPLDFSRIEQNLRIYLRKPQPVILDTHGLIFIRNRSILI